MNNYTLKDFFKKHRLVIISFIIIASIMPLLVNWWLIHNNCASEATDDGWASFFGSYLGGVLGGGATLFAVLFTIDNNHLEQEQNKLEEQDELIAKSAVIIYNDFDFIFNDILSFLNHFETMKKGKKRYNSMKEDDLEAFIFCKNHLNQFYFDSGWIHTVADLRASTFTAKDIRNIYKIYGYIMTINKALSSNEFNTCRNAYHTMYKIMKIETNPTSNAVKFTKRTWVEALIQKLKQITDNGN